MDLHALSLPDWLPWWAVLAVLVPAALWLALFLLMPFSTFGLRARLRELELRIDALHEEVRGVTLRLPDRGLDPYADHGQPPIPPAPRREAARDAAPRAGFGDPVADRMLDYMRDKVREDMQRADAPRAARTRAEPRFAPAPEPPPRTVELPPPPPLPDAEPPPEPPRPPRLGPRFLRRPPEPEAPGPDWSR